MELDLTNKQWLTPFELSFLVTGCKALWVQDRYAEVTVWANHGICSQIRLILRWAGHSEFRRRGMSDYNPPLVKVPGVVTLIEVSS